MKKNERAQGAIMPGGPDFQAGMKYCPEGLPAPQCTIGMQAPQGPAHCPYCDECRESKWWLKDIDASRARVKEFLSKRSKELWGSLSPGQKAEFTVGIERRNQIPGGWGALPEDYVPTKPWYKED